VYNVYDNCPNLDAATGKRSVKSWFEKTGKSSRWLQSFLANNLVNPLAYDILDAMGGVAANASNPVSGGGYDWTCGQFDYIPVYFARSDVRAALHLPDDAVTGSAFSYQSTGPASVTLYPALIKQIEVLIYNGDADSCVPYIGNEEWTVSMEDKGVVQETAPWHPWFQSPGSASPAGYATTYKADNTTFQFITLRLSGHQAPKNMPEAALTMFTAFLENKPL